MGKIVRLAAGFLLVGNLTACVLAGYRGTPGIPGGTTLTPLGNGNYTVSTANAVLDGVYISGQLTINADNVTVKNSHIDGPGGDDFPVVVVNGNNVTLSHNLIGNSNNVLSGHHGVALYGGGNQKVLGNEFIHTHGGLYLSGGGTDSDSVLFQDNYVHLMTALAGDHMNILSGVCASNVTIDHNTLDGVPAPGSQADTAFIQSAYSEDPTCPATASSPYVRASDGARIGAIKNLTFSNNHAAGEGSWGLFYPDIIGTVVITDNQIDPGPYGPLDAPTYVPYTGSGNIDLNGHAYPIEDGSINNK
jgi:hypothetical protein